MADIQRVSMLSDATLAVDPEGYLVWFKDHEAEITRLRTALAEAEARGYARAVEDAAIICEALNDKRLSGASGDFVASLASQRIRALAQKEAGE
jgi:hypothetical protein